MNYLKDMGYCYSLRKNWREYKMNDGCISKKRDLMELCQKIIPMMNEDEISYTALALNKTIERLLNEGSVLVE